MITDNVLQFEVMLNVSLLLLIICLSTYIVVQGTKLRRCEARLEEIRRTAKMQRETRHSSIMSFDDDCKHEAAA